MALNAPARIIAYNKHLSYSPITPMTTNAGVQMPHTVPLTTLTCPDDERHPVHAAPRLGRKYGTRIVARKASHAIASRDIGRLSAASTCRRHPFARVAPCGAGHAWGGGNAYGPHLLRRVWLRRRQ